MPMRYHYVYGVVYSPLEVDTDWETITRDDLVKMAHDFIASGKVDKIDMGHDYTPTGAEVVESFIARKDDPDYPEGAWVLGVRVEEGPLWDAIKSGKINGFSVAMTTMKVPKKVAVDIAKIALGDTEANTDIDSIAAHMHEYYVEFGEDGRVILGMTSNDLDHSHVILSTVRTEEAKGHTHRYFVD